MKYNIFIKKTILAVALLFIPSIMVADKIEIQDSTVIVVGKGQTNKKGVFTATGPIRIDSIIIDEIVLTYKGRTKGDLIITDSISNQSLFSKVVTNGMSKEEMNSLSFSLLAGHTYTIQHGKIMRWNIIIPTPISLDEEDLATDSTRRDTLGNKEETEGKTGKTEARDLSRLLWLIGCIIVVAGGSFYVYTRLRSKKDKKHEQKPQKEDTIVEEKVGNDPKIISDKEIQNDTENKIDNNHDIYKLIEEVEKGRKRLAKLKGIAALLGLKEDQLNKIEYKIGDLKNKANQNKQIGVKPPIIETPKNEQEPSGDEDIYTAQEEVTKELLGKFEQRDVFSKAIENAKKRCYVEEPKASEIFKYLIDEIAKILQSVNVVESESHSVWLKQSLKEICGFSYVEGESVRQNLERLISEKIKTTSDRKALEEVTPSIEIEKVVEEKLARAKVDWEADAKQNKENALAGKNKEIEDLKRQLKEKDGTVKDLEGQIVDKDEIISKKEQIIKDKESVISEKSQIISDRNSELQELKYRHKQELQTEVETLVNKLHQYTNAIEWRPMLDPCSNDDTTLNQCTDIENRLNAKLIEMKDRLAEFTTAENALPNLVRATIQDALVAEITTEESVVNSICRLFAYSNLSFMTDMKREYGVRLRRKNVHEVYKALENLYIQFGINFQIPPLFVMESKDGDYENVTGQAYSELGNLCPNVNNHCDNIDSEMKLKDIIVDIDKIGYAIDGSVQRNARILTF